jgi:hypothetical protein
MPAAIDCLSSAFFIILNKRDCAGTPVSGAIITQSRSGPAKVGCLLARMRLLPRADAERGR